MKTIILYVENDYEGNLVDDEIEVDFPAKWSVCPCCNGEGKTAFGHHNSNAIAWTQSEWEQEDWDFREDYMSGAYDRQCPECKGRTTILELDEKQIKKSKKLSYYLEKYQEQLQANAEIDAIYAAERRAGA